jgi:hypothetical protein
MLGEVAVETGCKMPDTVEELRAIEGEVEREWWWLNGALNAVAQVQAEQSHADFSRFRAMQAQAREVDRKRVAIAVRIAELEGGFNEHS